MMLLQISNLHLEIIMHSIANTGVEIIFCKIFNHLLSKGRLAVIENKKMHQNGNIKFAISYFKGTM